MEKSLTQLSKFGAFTAISALTLLSSAPFITPATAHAAEVINPWWPVSGVRMSGAQPFKAIVPGLDVSTYEMFWQVDDGQWNWMDSNYTDYPHKEISVDLTSWTWRGNGPYVVNFIARRNGTVIATAPITIYVDPVKTAPIILSEPAPVVAVTVTPVITQTAVPTVSAQVQMEAPVVSAQVQTATMPSPIYATNPLAGLTLYVNPNSPAATQAQTWQYSNPSWASMMHVLATQPTAVWLGEWNANVSETVRTAVAQAQSAGSMPVFVAYAIPQRDCGGYSSGGTNNPAAYASWIGQIASGIGSSKAIVILEPDALSQITCLSSSDQSARLSLIADAVTTLKKNPNTKVYIDAGHSGWIDAGTMAQRLNQANVSVADGFALNVSNFMSTSDETAYGAAISKQVNNKHFVIDTSRNGNGSDGAWCNPSGRAIGIRPTTATGNALIDAYLWIKVPGESDGWCNGGPSAGSWWPSYALDLVQNARLSGL